MAETPVGRFAAPGLPKARRRSSASARRRLRIRPAGRACQDGVQHRQFLGHVDLMEVAVEGLERPLKGRILRDAIPQR